MYIVIHSLLLFLIRIKNQYIDASLFIKVKPVSNVLQICFTPPTPLTPPKKKQIKLFFILFCDITKLLLTRAFEDWEEI